MQKVTSSPIRSGFVCSVQVQTSCPNHGAGSNFHARRIASSIGRPRSVNPMPHAMIGCGIMSRLAVEIIGSIDSNHMGASPYSSPSGSHEK